MTASVTSIKMYHRCPKCPKCGGPSVTVPHAARPECYNYSPTAPKVNLVCCACGEGWLGTSEELAQATRADAAYEKALKEGRV